MSCGAGLADLMRASRFARSMDFVLSRHAQVSAEEREIPLEWIRSVLEQPHHREADGREDGVELFYAKIAA